MAKQLHSQFQTSESFRSEVNVAGFRFKATKLELVENYSDGARGHSSIIPQNRFLLLLFIFYFFIFFSSVIIGVMRQSTIL